MSDNIVDEEHLKDILTASYQPQREAEQTLAKRGYKYDYELSNMENKVFYNPETQQSHIAYRGSTRAKDWAGNVKLGLGLKDQDIDRRVELAGKVKEKYGSAPTTYGHSRGSVAAERAGDKYGGKTYTFNKAATPSDVFKTIRPEQTDIRTSKDVVSLLSVGQKGGTKKTLTTPLTTSVIGSHSVSQLSNAPQKSIKDIVKETIKKPTITNVSKLFYR